MLAFLPPTATSTCRRAPPAGVPCSKGLYENCCDNDATMAVLSQLTVPGMPWSWWDNAAFVPDAVLINLGT